MPAVGINKVDPKLVSENYYHGILSSDDVKLVLKKDGDFLVCIPEEVGGGRVRFIGFLSKLFLTVLDESGALDALRGQATLLHNWQDEAEPLPRHASWLRLDSRDGGLLHGHARAPSREPPSHHQATDSASGKPISGNQPYSSEF